MTDGEKKPDETPVVLVKGQQADETWEEFEQRVVKAFRDAGLLKSRKPKDPDGEQRPS